MLDPQSVYLFIFLDHFLTSIIPPPWCMIFQISSSSPPFDMLVKLLLEFLFNLPFWTYLPFALFTMCSVSLLSFQINAVLDSPLDFWFQSIFLTQKYLDMSIPRILMPVQVVWRMELLVRHEESSRSSWKLYHLLTFLLMLDEEFRAPPKNQAWARLWHSHYHYNHEGGVNAGHVEGDTCHPWRS